MLCTKKWEKVRVSFCLFFVAYQSHTPCIFCYPIASTDKSVLSKKWVWFIYMHIHTYIYIHTCIVRKKEPSWMELWLLVVHLTSFWYKRWKKKNDGSKLSSNHEWVLLNECFLRDSSRQELEVNATISFSDKRPENKGNTFFFLAFSLLFLFFCYNE